MNLIKNFNSEYIVTRGRTVVEEPLIPLFRFIGSGSLTHVNSRIVRTVRTKTRLEL